MNARDVHTQIALCNMDADDFEDWLQSLLEEAYDNGIKSANIDLKPLEDWTRLQYNDLSYSDAQRDVANMINLNLASDINDSVEDDFDN